MCVACGFASTCQTKNSRRLTAMGDGWGLSGGLAESLLANLIHHCGGPPSPRGRLRVRPFTIGDPKPHPYSKISANVPLLNQPTATTISLPRGEGGPLAVDEVAHTRKGRENPALAGDQWSPLRWNISHQKLQVSTIQSIDFA